MSEGIGQSPPMSAIRLGFESSVILLPWESVIVVGNAPKMPKQNSDKNKIDFFNICPLRIRYFTLDILQKVIQKRLSFIHKALSDVKVGV